MAVTKKRGKKKRKPIRKWSLGEDLQLTVSLMLASQILRKFLPELDKVTGPPPICMCGGTMCSDKHRKK